MALSDKLGFFDEVAKVWWRFDTNTHAFIPVEDSAQDLGSPTNYINYIYCRHITGPGGGAGILNYYPVFNVKYYGAVGNGVTDDTAAIALANTDAGVAGGVVVFPPGTYLSDHVQTLHSGTHYFGYGATFLSKTDYGFRLAHSDCGVHGFALTSNRFAPAPTFIGVNVITGAVDGGCVARDLNIQKFSVGIWASRDLLAENIVFAAPADDAAHLFRCSSTSAYPNLTFRHWKAGTSASPLALQNAFLIGDHVGRFSLSDSDINVTEVGLTSAYVGAMTIVNDAGVVEVERCSFYTTDTAEPVINIASTSTGEVRISNCQVIGGETGIAAAATSARSIALSDNYVESGTYGVSMDSAVATINGGSYTGAGAAVSITGTGDSLTVNGANLVSGIGNPLILGGTGSVIVDSSILQSASSSLLNVSGPALLKVTDCRMVTGSNAIAISLSNCGYVELDSCHIDAGAAQGINAANTVTVLVVKGCHIVSTTWQCVVSASPTVAIENCTLETGFDYNINLAATTVKANITGNTRRSSNVGFINGTTTATTYIANNVNDADTVTAPGFPATGVPVQNTTGRPLWVTCAPGGGALNTFYIDGVATGNTSFNGPLRPGGTVTIDWAGGAPTWVWHRAN